jgi:hypothetical protein
MDRSRQVRYYIQTVNGSLDIRTPDGGWKNYVTARTFRSANRKALRLSRKFGPMEVSQRRNGKKFERYWTVGA